MSDTTTPNYGFDLPTVGASQDTWGGKLNANWVAADSAIHGLASGYLPLAGGGTINGILQLSPASGYAALFLNKPHGTTAEGNLVQGNTAGLARWLVLLGTAEAESGGNAGSNFGVERFDDSGNYLGTPFSISRANGNVTIAQALYVNGGINAPVGTFSSSVSVTGLMSATTVQSGSGIFEIAPNYYLGRGSDAIWRFVENGTVNLSLDTGGNFAVRGRVTGNDIMNNSGVFYVSGGNNNYFARNTSDAAWRWVENYGQTMILDHLGNLTVSGTVHGTNVTAMADRLEELAARIEELTARVTDLEALRLA